MPADYLSRNIVEAIRITDEDLAEKQSRDPLCQTVKNILENKPIQQMHKKKFLKPAEKMAQTCFIENYLLWTRITRHQEKRTVLVVPESIVNAQLAGIHWDMLYGHEGQFKTKERIMQSYWWRGMDQDINDFLSKCEKCQSI
jgi:hypothetical protein